MSEILSPDRIAALLEAAKQGELPDAVAAVRRRGHRLRTVDFARPTKFNTDQKRRIVRAVEAFCQSAVTRLSTELRVPVELEVLNTLQLTWSAAQAQLPAGSIPVLVDMEPGATQMLLTAEQSFVLCCLECLLGGSPERQPKERRMSEIDFSLTRRLFETLVHHLSQAWQEIGAVTLSTGEIDTHELASVASVSEPTLTLLIECRILKRSFSLALLIPWLAVESLMVRNGGIADHDAEDRSEALAAITSAMSAVPVMLRAEVADVELAVAEILALAPGSVVRFGSRSEDGVSLYAENIKLAGAMPGCSGARRAIQIRRTDGPRS
jgi:flagellar motor switch protein FliM